MAPVIRTVPRRPLFRRIGERHLHDMARLTEVAQASGARDGDPGCDRQTAGAHRIRTSSRFRPHCGSGRGRTSLRTNVGRPRRGVCGDSAGSRISVFPSSPNRPPRGSSAAMHRRNHLRANRVRPPYGTGRSVARNACSKLDGARVCGYGRRRFERPQHGRLVMARRGDVTKQFCAPMAGPAELPPCRRRRSRRAPAAARPCSSRGGHQAKWR